MSLLAIALKLIAVLFGIWLALHLLLRPGRVGEPEIIAHRGAAAYAPENTLASVQAAVMSGAELIEVDVQRSLDGVLILMHDATVDRTTDGTGEVGRMTYAELAELDAGSWFSPTFAGEQVPRLDQVFELLDGWSGTLVVEAKFPEAYPGIEVDLAEMFTRFGTTSVSVVSFNHAWLTEFHSLASEVPLGLLSLYPLRLEPQAGAARIGVYWPSVLLDPSLVRRARRAGLGTWVYTVDPPALRSTLAWLGVEGITTNSP